MKLELIFSWRWIHSSKQQKPKCASDYNSLFLSIGFVVGGMISKLLAVSAMSVLVFHFLRELSPVLDPPEAFWKEREDELL